VNIVACQFLWVVEVVVILISFSNLIITIRLNVVQRNKAIKIRVYHRVSNGDNLINFPLRKGWNINRIKLSVPTGLSKKHSSLRCATASGIMSVPYSESKGKWLTSRSITRHLSIINNKIWLD
jgi:hypothetical protein